VSDWEPPRPRPEYTEIERRLRAQGRCIVCGVKLREFGTAKPVRCNACRGARARTYETGKLRVDLKTVLR